MKDYVPIACALHDRLEHLALRQQRCRIDYASGSGESHINGVVADILTADGAEYLVVAETGQRIRLDAIIAIQPL